MVIAGDHLAAQSPRKFNRKTICQRNPANGSFQFADGQPKGVAKIPTRKNPNGVEIAKRSPRHCDVETAHKIIINFAEVNRVGKALIVRIEKDPADDISTRFASQIGDHGASIEDAVHRRRSSRAISRRFSAAKRSLLVGTWAYRPITASINSARGRCLRNFPWRRDLTAVAIVSILAPADWDSKTR